jgi:hypothetical protein
MAVHPAKHVLSVSLTTVLGMLALLAGVLSIYGNNLGLQSLHLPFSLSRSTSTVLRHSLPDIQIFSQDPLVLYIHNFVSQDEISHLLDAR